MNVLGVELSELTRNEIVNLLTEKIDAEEKFFVVTANSMIILSALKDESYKAAVSMADLVIPDGFGVILAAKLKHKKVLERYPGVELTKDLLDIGKKKGWRFYLLGATERVVKKLKENLDKEGIEVCGYHHGYFEGNGPVEEIVYLKPDVILVAMGVPKQELWIAKNIERFEKGLFIGVGGTFDVLSGEKKRAPKWMRESGFEWLYRIFQSPLRRWNVPFKIAEFFLRVLFDP